MSDLHDLNRDEWAGKPYLIELRGGQNDGKRFRWRDLPTVWRQPEDHCKSLLEMAIDYGETPDGPTNPSRSYTPVADYWITDHVTDDGYRIYQHE